MGSDPIAEVSRLYKATSIVLVPSSGESDFLYQVRCVSEDNGELKLIGHCTLDDGGAELVFFDLIPTEIHRVTRSRPAFQDLMNLHVHERKSISVWTSRDCREFLRRVFNPQHKLCSLNVSFTGKTLMVASAKQLKLKKPEFDRLHELINAELVLEMEKKRLEESLLVSPPPLENESVLFGTMLGIATVLGIDAEETENLSPGQTLRLILNADASEKVVKNSIVDLVDVLSLFEPLPDLSLTELDASDALKQLDEISDVPSISASCFLLTHEELCSVVAQQGRRIDQLEALVATMMAQSHEAATVAAATPKPRLTRLSSSTGAIGSPKFPRLKSREKLLKE